MARPFDSLFSGLPAGSPRVMGVVHLAPLPGSPGYDEKVGMTGILDRALRDAASLAGGGMAGIVVENFGDAPFWKDAVPPETVAAMARAATEIRRTVTIPVGINVLRNDALAALGIAAACQADFIRVNVLCGPMVTEPNTAITLPVTWPSMREEPNTVTTSPSMRSSSATATSEKRRTTSPSSSTEMCGPTSTTRRGRELESSPSTVTVTPSFEI